MEPGAAGLDGGLATPPRRSGRLLEAGTTLEDIQPGVTYHARRHGTLDHPASARLGTAHPEQQQRLRELGAGPAVQTQKTPTRNSAKVRAGKGTDAFERGVAALQQYIQREGKTVVGRQHIEQLPDGTPVRLGVFLSNQKSRRDRLSEQQLAALAGLGLEWAV